MNSPFSETQQNPHFESVIDVEPLEVQKQLSSIKLVDVREPDEFTGELGHIKNSVLVPLAKLPEEIESLNSSDHIVFICRSGGRSAKASYFANQQGFTNTYNMKGGMLLWNDLQLKTEK